MFSVSREAMTTAEPPEPLDSFAVGFSFFKTSLPELVGSAARLFQCIQCILWCKISCSFVPFVVLHQRFDYGRSRRKRANCAAHFASLNGFPM